MIDLIKQMFDNLTLVGWIGQIAGLIGFFIILISHQFKRTTYIILSLVSFVFFILEQFCCKVYANAFITIMAFVRFFLLILWIKKGKEELPPVLLGMILVVTYLGMGIYMILTRTLSDWTNYIPLIMYTQFAILSNKKNYYLVKLGAFLNEAGFLVYYFATSLPLSMMREVILILSIVVSVLVMWIKARKEQKKA